MIAFSRKMTVEEVLRELYVYIGGGGCRRGGGESKPRGRDRTCRALGPPGGLEAEWRDVLNESYMEVHW